MDIACPNCAATYRVPDSLLAHGAPLRCAACGHQWVPAMAPLPVAEPVIPEPEVPQPVMPEVAAPAEPPAAPAPRPPLPTSPPPLQRRNSSGIPIPVRRAPGRRSGRLLPMAWMASVTVVLLALLALVFFGEDIAAAWPPFGHVSARLAG